MQDHVATEVLEAEAFREENERLRKVTHLLFAGGDFRS